MRIYLFEDLKERKIVNSRVSLNRWIKMGLFPPPIDLGPRRIGFDADRVDAMLKSRQRPAPAALQPSEAA